MGRLAIVVTIIVLLTAACAGQGERSQTPSTASLASPAAPRASSSPLSVTATTSASPGEPTAAAAPSPTAAPDGALLLVTASARRRLTIVDPAAGVVGQVDAGVAPWEVALAADGRAWVATAEGVAVVDVAGRARVALVPYASEVGDPLFGEYRPGGMGIAVAPDQRRVYVGVHLPGGGSRLEVIDVERLAVTGSVAVGIRPFQVLASADGREVYTIDHDSFTVTAVDTATLAARTIDVAPLGRGAFDKPHYAALRPDGHLLLPYQGEVVVDLDPATGQWETIATTAATHQHGVTLAPDGRLLVVGTGPAGGAPGGPNLAILDLDTGQEEVVPLDKPHEDLLVSRDGRTAYLTGGYTFANGGWDGITAVDLASGTTREIPVPGRPLGIVEIAG